MERRAPSELGSEALGIGRVAALSDGLFAIALSHRAAGRGPG
jgi:hypothetical protein